MTLIILLGRGDTVYPGGILRPRDVTDGRGVGSRGGRERWRRTAVVYGSCTLLFVIVHYRTAINNCERPMAYLQAHRSLKVAHSPLDAIHVPAGRSHYFENVYKYLI